MARTSQALRLLIQRHRTRTQPRPPTPPGCTADVWDKLWTLTMEGYRRV